MTNTAGLFLEPTDIPNFDFTDTTGVTDVSSRV